MGLLLLCAIEHALASPSWDHRLLLAGAADSLEVTLQSRHPLPKGAKTIDNWLMLPKAAGCQRIASYGDAPDRDAGKPVMKYVWLFRCERLNQLTRLSFRPNDSDDTKHTDRLYLQWVLPTTQGHLLVAEPISGFDLSAARQDGGTL